MKVRAVLVGIEKYSHGVPPVPAGPSQNALDLAQWLTDHGTPPANIHLFLSPEEPLQDPLAAQAPLPEYDVLNKFLREALPGLLQPDELLLFYWAGHGITMRGRHRVVLYQNFSDKKPNYALSLTEFGETLDDIAMFRSRQHLFLIDACANKVHNIRPQPQEAAPVNWQRSNRYEVHAALEGDYAINGDFSRHLLAFLKSGANWDTAAQFYDGFTTHLANQNFRPYTVEFVSSKETKALDKQGIPAPAGVSADLLNTLENLPIPLREVQTLYQRSIEDLGLPALWNVTSTAGMLKELQDLKDDRPLIQFILRARRAAPSKELDDWLRSKPATIVLDVESDLDREAMERYLVIVLSDDPMKLGQIASVEAHLYPENFADPIHDYPRTAVADWDAAAKTMAAILDDANARPGGKLHLQFVVSVPMLASAPHQIEDLDAVVVGRNYSAVLRTRDRFYRPNSLVAVRWRQRAEEIRKAAQLIARPLPGRAGKALVEALDPSTVYYLSAPVARQRKYSAAPAPVMAALRDAIDQGAPFLCFIHAPADENWQTILEQKLNEWLQAGLRSFPARLCDRRSKYDDYASGISVLWDDPTHLPKSPPKFKELR